MPQAFWNAVAKVTEVWTKLPQLMYEYSMLLNVIVVLAIVGVIGYFYFRDKAARRRKFLIQRGRKMTRQERQLYLRDIIGEKICDVIEDLEFNGKISRPEARTIYRRLAQILTIKALLPAKAQEPKLSTHELLNIKKLLFGDKPVRIPGPKPGENVVPFPKKEGKKPFGSAFISRKSASA